MIHTTDKYSFKSFIIDRALKIPNHIAVLLSAIAVLVCFSPSLLPFIVAMVISVGYLILTTKRYVDMLNNQCPWEINVASGDSGRTFLHNRISIIASVFVIVTALTFTALLVSMYSVDFKSLYNDHLQSILRENIDANIIVYFIGFAKFIMMYLVLEKIHSCWLMTTMLIRCPHTLSNFTIDRANIVDPSKLYPVIYLDGRRISSDRYSVSIDKDIIGVSFNPPLSMNNDSRVEYEFNEVGDNKIYYRGVCTHQDHSKCAFKCRRLVSKKA